MACGRSAAASTRPGFAHDWPDFLCAEGLTLTVRRTWFECWAVTRTWPSREEMVRFEKHESMCCGRAPLHVPLEDLCLARVGTFLPPPPPGDPFLLANISAGTVSLSGR